jgi:hypothetical protein
MGELVFVIAACLFAGFSDYISVSGSRERFLCVGALVHQWYFEAAGICRTIGDMLEWMKKDWSAC